MHGRVGGRPCTGAPTHGCLRVHTPLRETRTDFRPGAFVPRASARARASATPVRPFVPHARRGALARSLARACPRDERDRGGVASDRAPRVREEWHAAGRGHMPRGARWRRGAGLRGMQRRPSPLAAVPAAAAAALTLVQLVGCAADAPPGNSTGGVASSATFLATAAIGALGALALVLAAVVTTAAISHRARQRLKRGSGGSGTGSAGSR